MIPKSLLATPLRTGIGCMFIDQFLHTPFLYIPAFFLTAGLLQGWTFDKSIAVMREGFWMSLLSTWVMWVPLQTMNFSVVPQHYRVLVLCAGCLVWNIVNDYIAHNAAKTLADE
eukprot:TRINITY_DN28013_c0_g1_i1.p1 TRINITY_DN28013_c0_g1~~TRINITY_DN28013_c0_g1_i1.p1  ORF type:complete len:114 (-),score=10.55 TRINITY_DN28013_c0_g1_i1:290-631(-)